MSVRRFRLQTHRCCQRRVRDYTDCVASAPALASSRSHEFSACSATDSDVRAALVIPRNSFCTVRARSASFHPLCAPDVAARD